MAQTKREILAKYEPKVESAAPVESQQLRTAIQGASFGFGDEIEAFIRSSFSDRKYDEIRDELRAKITAYKKANPAESLTTELAAALVPSIAISMTGFGAPAAATNLGRFGQALKPIVAESAVAAADIVRAI